MTTELEAPKEANKPKRQERVIVLSDGRKITMHKISWYRRQELELKNTPPATKLNPNPRCNIAGFLCDMIVEGTDGQITAEEYKSEEMSNNDGALLQETASRLNVVDTSFLAHFAAEDQETEPSEETSR